MSAATLPEVQRKLVHARDEQMARVVALVDALPQRGDADLLIAPLRPRLAQLAPGRPMTVQRLLFRPLDPVIVPGAQWRPGMAAVPRTALGCLAASVLARLGPAGVAAQAILAAVPPGPAPDLARDAAARAGLLLWPAATAALEGLLTPPDWTSATGLPLPCFAPVRDGVAAVLRQAARLAALHAVPAGDARFAAGVAAGVAAILADAQAAPAGLEILLAVLLSHGPTAAAVAGGLPGSLPAAALNAAVAQSLDRAGDVLARTLPAVGLGAAAGHAADVAALVDAVDQPATRAVLREQASRTRQAADQACQARIAQAAADLVPHLPEGSPADAVLDDLAVDRLEGTARDLRRLGRAGRQLGHPATYDALLTQVAAQVGADDTPGLTRMDRLRLAELLVGAQAALRLVPGDEPA